MSFFLGIDLGSTTSKAILVDGDLRVVGRGITNTRSNYDVATAVARGEALIDAQFSFLQGRLGKDLGDGAARVATEIRRAARVCQSIERLEKLRQRVLALAHQAPGGGEEEATRIDRIFGRMLTDADDFFGPLAHDRSRFFRDIVGARFLSEAERLSQAHELNYSVALGSYDQAIVETENLESATTLDALFAAALSRAALGSGEKKTLEEVWHGLEGARPVVENMVGTGYGRQRLPFPKEQIRSEILCHGLGAHALFPGTRTVLDIGGQDTKAIQVDGSGLVTSFQMNDRCAAGCGRYLGYIADEMNLGIHELGPLAMTAARPVKITSTCTVFAGVELRERLSLGEKRENILLGLHHAIVLRAMSLLARSGGIRDEFTFTGGVAKNPAVVQELKGLVAKHYGERTLNIHPDSIYTGALGAALFASRDRARPGEVH